MPILFPQPNLTDKPPGFRAPEDWLGKQSKRRKSLLPHTLCGLGLVLGAGEKDGMRSSMGWREAPAPPEAGLAECKLLRLSRGGESVALA